MAGEEVSSTQRRLQHWEDVWQARDPERVTWYQPSLTRSLAIIDGLSLPREHPIVDVGGGASTFVDDMLARGFEDITVLDISAAALKRSRQRLGDAASAIHWIEADVLTVRLPAAFQLWHDRAVFHFLTEPADRAAYATVLREALRPDGRVLIATFGPDGPERCSGLPTSRYSGTTLLAALGPGWQLCAAELEDHVSPAGVRQQFLYALLQRSRGAPPRTKGDTGAHA